MRRWLIFGFWQHHSSYGASSRSIDVVAIFIAFDVVQFRMQIVVSFVGASNDFGQFVHFIMVFEWLMMILFDISATMSCCGVYGEVRFDSTPVHKWGHLTLVQLDLVVLSLTYSYILGETSLFLLWIACALEQHCFSWQRSQPLTSVTNLRWKSWNTCYLR